MNQSIWIQFAQRKWWLATLVALFAEETKFNSQLRTMPQFFPSLSSWLWNSIIMTVELYHPDCGTLGSISLPQSTCQPLTDPSVFWCHESCWSVYRPLSVSDRRLLASASSSGLVEPSFSLLPSPQPQTVIQTLTHILVHSYFLLKQRRQAQILNCQMISWIFISLVLVVLFQFNIYKHNYHYRS